MSLAEVTVKPLGLRRAQPVNPAGTRGLALVGLSIPVLGVLGLFGLSGGIRNLLGDTLAQVHGILVLRENAPSDIFSDLPAEMAEVTTTNSRRSCRRAADLEDRPLDRGPQPVYPDCGGFSCRAPRAAASRPAQSHPDRG